MERQTLSSICFRNRPPSGDLMCDMLSAPDSSEQGHAFLELAILLPIVLVSIFILIEVGFVYNSREEVGLMSRHAAYAAYRVCVAGKTQATIPGCLQNIIHEELEEISTEIIHGFFVPPESGILVPTVNYRGAVILSAYQWQAASQQWRRIAADTIGNPTFISRYPEFASSTVMAPGADIPAVLSNYETLVIAEVYFRFQPVTPLLNLGRAFGSITSIPDEFYDATIM